MNDMRLTPPPEKTPVESAIEMCELMIEEGIADVLAIRGGGQAKRPSHLGIDYDEAYAQGKKDTCRIILISLGVQEVGQTSETVKHG